MKKPLKNYTKNIEHKEGWIEDKVYACINRADCYRFLEDPEKELASLFESLRFSKTPRPEMCSRVGATIFKEKKNISLVYWYELATTIEDDPDKWSFTYPAYSTWYPHLQLCVCYYNLSDFHKSYEHNELARSFRPQDERVIFNKELLENKLGLNQTTEEPIDESSSD